MYAQFLQIMVYISNDINLSCNFQALWVALGKTVQGLTQWITIGNKLVRSESDINVAI